MVEATAVESRIEELAPNFRGQLVSRGDDTYDAARKVWNGAIDKHPAVIARCSGVADVIAAVNFARTNDVSISVRGGGHGVAGKAVAGEMVIDLSPMKGIWVDPGTRTARAQAGVLWGEFDRETQTFGLATTGGIVTTTGIAGLTLGGGIGWLNGKYGLACDNLLSAQIVTADGQLLNASATENEDLFWALRGGSGNFGVVTSFEYRLHPVGQVLAGLVAHPISKAKEVLEFYREFTSSSPDELTVYAGCLTGPPEPFIPQHLQGKPLVVMVLAYAGSLDEGERIVRPLREFASPEVDVVAPMPYTALQSMFDAGAGAGLHNYWKSGFLSDLTDEAIERIIRFGGDVPSPMTQIFLEQIHGAARRVAPDETAFPQRDAMYNFGIFSVWTEAADSERQMRWTREFWGAMEGFSTGGVYVNYLSEDEADRTAAAFRGNYNRLAAIKAKYDPQNLFRHNQNIKPAA